MAALAPSHPLHAEVDDAGTARPALALMGTIPIYWGEAGDFDEALEGNAPRHWARAVLEESYQLAPLDFLTTEALESHRNLLMAQPRALAASENVALDGWVRGGGRLLLLADPMMTGASRFALGDRRRPQDVALLSPILAHWGMELFFDEEQAAGPRVIDAASHAIPVDLAGELALAENGACELFGEELVAHCRIGEGEALVIADAAMLDIESPAPQAESALRFVVAHIFGESGDDAGNGGFASDSPVENRAFPSGSGSD